MAKAKKKKNEDEILQEIKQHRDMAREMLQFLDSKGVEEPDRVLTFALGTILGAMYEDEKVWKITTKFVLQLARHARDILNAKMGEANAEA